MFSFLVDFDFDYVKHEKRFEWQSENHKISMGKLFPPLEIFKTQNTQISI